MTAYGMNATHHTEGDAANGGVLEGLVGMHGAILVGITNLEGRT